MHAWGWDYSHELRDITAYVHADCYFTDLLEERGHLEIFRDYMSTYVSGETQGKLLPWETPPSLLPDDEDLDMYTAQKAVEWITGYEDDKPFYLQVNFPGPHNPFDSPSTERALYDPADMPPAILDQTYRSPITTSAAADDCQQAAGYKDQSGTTHAAVLLRQGHAHRSRHRNADRCTFGKGADGTTHGSSIPPTMAKCWPTITAATKRFFMRVRSIYHC